MRAFLQNIFAPFHLSSTKFDGFLSFFAAPKVADFPFSRRFCHFLRPDT